MSTAAPTAREREFKLGIPDEASFRRLIEAAGGRADPPVLQENHFFDSPARSLRARALGLRIRREAGRLRLTLKGPSERSGDALVSDRGELEVELAPDEGLPVLRGERPISALFPRLEEAAARSGGGALVDALRAAVEEAAPGPIGGFRNTRTRVHTVFEDAGGAHPVVLEFDRTEFAPDDVRREVELEIAPDASEEALRRGLEALFARVGVAPVATSSKLAHFLSRLDRA